MSAVLRASLLLALVACGSNSSQSTGDAPAGNDDGAHPGDARGANPDGARGIDAAMGSDNGVDGTPVRQACTSNFGNALPSSGTFGRMDGYLVAIVAPGSTNGCNDDSGHVHLQIKMNGDIYDIAIDATDSSTHTDDVHTTAMDIPMPTGPAWSEGFHTGVSLDYPTTLGVHSANIPLQTKAEIVAAFQSDLATVNHISIFTTTYGNNGAHLVHRDGSSHDGAVVTEPLSSTTHVRVLSFDGQSF